MNHFKINDQSMTTRLINFLNHKSMNIFVYQRQSCINYLMITVTNTQLYSCNHWPQHPVCLQPQIALEFTNVVASGYNKP